MRLGYSFLGINMDVILQPNRKPIMMSLRFFALLKVSTETIKNSKHYILKVIRLHYIAILSKS